MNRQLRRQAERQKRMPPPRMRRWAQPTAKPTLYEIDYLFSPIDRAFSQLASGQVDSASGKPVFSDQDGKYYELCPAVRGFVCALERIAKAHKLTLDFAPIIKLCNKLEACMPIAPEHIKECQSLIDSFRAAYRRMDMHFVKSLATTEMIAQELETRVQS